MPGSEARGRERILPTAETMLLVVFFLTLCAGLTIGWHLRRVSAIEFFSSALRDASAREIVGVAQEKYAVDGGHVTRIAKPSGNLSSYEMYSALRIAYGATLARRSPIFGLAGTDPDRLEVQLSELKKVQAETAALQRSPSTHRDVAKYLYPIEFLTGLASAERARQAFLDNPSDTTMRTYQNALNGLLSVYQRNLSQFKSALKRNAPDTLPLVLLDGTITKQSLLNALQNAHKRMRTVTDMNRKRQACTLGAYRACAPSELPRTQLQDHSETSDAHASLSLVRDVASILSTAHPPNVDFLSRKNLVALHGSVCAKGFAEPHYFLQSMEAGTGKSPVESLVFIGDLLSYPQDPKVPRADVFAFFSPTTYYLCPFIGEDVSRASATQAVYRRLYPTNDLSFKSGTILDEGMAREYIQTLGEQADADGLTLMFADNSAGLDILIRDIIAQQRAVARAAAGNKDTDVSAGWNFFVRSGFASLFLLHHRTMSPRINIFSEEHGDSGSARILKWSELQTKMSRSEVITDIKRFLDAHRGEMVSD